MTKEVAITNTIENGLTLIKKGIVLIKILEKKLYRKNLIIKTLIKRIKNLDKELDRVNGNFYCINKQYKINVHKSLFKKEETGEKLKSRPKRYNNDRRKT